jgi:hypothetical protein
MGMSHESCDERSMVTISEARKSTIARNSEFQLANLKYQNKKRIIELKWNLNRTKYNGNARSVVTWCASKNMENSKYLLDTDKFSNSNGEFKDGFVKLNLKKDKQRLEKVMLLLEAATEDRLAAFEERDAAIKRREAAYDVTPQRRKAAHDVTSREREAAYEIIRGRRECA